MAQLRGPRPDPGPGGRAKPNPKKPKVLQEAVPFTATDVTAKLRKEQAAKDKKMEETTTQVRQAVKAIKAGTAEAHPIVQRTGIETIGMSKKEAADVGETFGRSLSKSYNRREKARRPARMATPSSGQDFASKRKPVRKATRQSGSGR